MNKNTLSQSSHFRSGGTAYAKFRPTYPAELLTELANLVPARHLAVDVGCGTGQFSIELSKVFERVIASDISQSQIDNAIQNEHITYFTAPAHRLPVQESSCNLISVAQAVHWFELDKFYTEVRRIAAPDAILALISYGVMQIAGPISIRFEHFYWQSLAPFWPAERKHVETGYTKLAFPFTELEFKKFYIEREWNLAQLLGYIDTWSAVKAAKRNGELTMIETFYKDVENLWGDANNQYRLKWPLNVRIGKL